MMQIPMMQKCMMQKLHDAETAETAETAVNPETAETAV